MKKLFLSSLAFVIGFGSLGYSSDGGQTAVPADVQAIIARSCSVSGCHRGRFPTGSMNLEAKSFLSSTLDVPSREVPSKKIIDPAAPEQSYLLAKIKGEPGIVGLRMPANRAPLSADEVGTVEAWVLGLKGGSPRPSGAAVSAGGAGGGDPQGQPAAARKAAPARPAFWGTRIVNLPTAETIDKGGFLFRISHRFIPPVSVSEDGFYGLDGPAFILLSLGYAITDRFMLSVGRTNYNQEWELNADYRLFERPAGSALPLAGALHVGGSLVSQDKPPDAQWSGRFRFDALFSLSWQVTDRVSLLAVPGFASNTNFQQPNSKGTFSLGVGGRVLVFSDFSIIGEWVPVLTGYKDFANGWSLGLEKKIGGHVFQVFVNNCLGLTPAQYLIGGDLGRFSSRLSDRLRLGFNIFRTF